MNPSTNDNRSRISSRQGETKIKTFDRQFFIYGGIALVTIVIICFLPYWFAGNGTQKAWVTFSENSNQIGDTIGGIMGPFVGIIGAMLTFLAFWIQFKANIQLREDIKTERLRNELAEHETRFFEMVRFHRENVNQMEMDSAELIKDTNSWEKFQIKGRDYFYKVDCHFKDILKENNHIIKKIKFENIYLEQYLNQLCVNKVLNPAGITLPINSSEELSRSQKSLQQKLLDYALVDISWCMVFYGISDNSLKILDNCFGDKYGKHFYEIIINSFIINPKWFPIGRYAWTNMHRNIDNGYPLSYVNTMLKIASLNHNPNEFNSRFSKIIFNGIQSSMGHYFRNLYQSISFIDVLDENVMDENRKYENIKMLRGQMSSYEQMILCYNSLSHLGRIWELEDYKNESQPPVRKDGSTLNLITKYDLLRNVMSDEILEGIKISTFYPSLRFEWNSRANDERPSLA